MTQQRNREQDGLGYFCPFPPPLPYLMIWPAVQTVRNQAAYFILANDSGFLSKFGIEDSLEFYLITKYM